MGLPERTGSPRALDPGAAREGDRRLDDSQRRGRGTRAHNPGLIRPRVYP